MTTPPRRAVVLWTGGKDSCLALHLARERPLEIVALVTFVPRGGAEFRAHPQREMADQARRLGLPLHLREVVEPYRESYVESLAWVARELGAGGVVVTGDIDVVGGHPNWIEECCSGLPLEVWRPLWLKPRDWVLEELLRRGIVARVSYVAHPALPPAQWLHRTIDADFVRDVRVVAEATGIDIAGENGEYHSMVVEAPAFCMP